MYMLVRVMLGRTIGTLRPFIEIGHELILDHRNEYLNSKAGIAEYADEEE